MSTRAVAVAYGEDFDDHLSAIDFGRIARLVESEAGIKMPPGKRLMVEGRLRKRMRALGIPTFADYCNMLFKQGGLEHELTYLINAVTTNKTDFFREPEHFDFLASHMVPNLIKQRGERNPLLKFWSAAASTGAEAYTLSMVLRDLMLARRDFRFAILGTDISTQVLAQGQRAVYPAEMIAPVPAALQERYVLHARKPGLRPEVRMAPEIRRHVQFQHLNLMDTTYPFDRDVDVIFLRNVLIYFEKSDQATVVGRRSGISGPAAIWYSDTPSR